MSPTAEDGSFIVRSARTSDVASIITMAGPLVDKRVLVPKEAVTYYESIQEFLVAEDRHGELIGFGALHVMWEDLAEVRTLATLDSWRGHGVGSALLAGLRQRAEDLGVSRVFCLTFGSSTSSSATASKSWLRRRRWTLRSTWSCCAHPMKVSPSSSTLPGEAQHLGQHPNAAAAEPLNCAGEAHSPRPLTAKPFSPALFTDGSSHQQPLVTLWPYCDPHGPPSAPVNLSP